MELASPLAAIVTGGASGLGEASARMLASRGLKVTLFDLNAERGKTVAAEIGGLFCAVDVTDEASVDAGLEKARGAHGAERVLVNCAGIVLGRRTVSTKRGTGELQAHDLDSFRKTIEVNLVGTFHMIAKSALAMAALDTVDEQGSRGVIISTSSVAATDGQIGQAAYSASKGGILGLTLPVARDLAQYGVRVVAIQPGIFETPMFASMPDNVREALAAEIPFPQRLGRADEFADLVRYICESDYVNGEAIRLDGAVRLTPR